MHKRSSFTFGSVLFAASLATIGCTGADGTNGTNGSNGSNGSNGLSSIVQTSEEPAGTNCPTGGTKLETGQDTDGDGVLSGAEIAQTIYVCNGDEGATGNQTLLAITDEPAGANCVAGGKKIDYGVDDNANGTLEPEEVDGTAYTCDGPDGLGSLIAMTTEPPGANCGLGGTKITSGIDDNEDGTLDPGEVDATSYVCSAVPPAVLYLSQDDNADGLYTLDLATGQATHIGATDTLGNTVGLTYDPSEGVLLGSRWQTLLAIPIDGTGPTDRGGSPAEALAYDYVDHVLYATINGTFYKMDKTNGANLGSLANPGVDVEGLAFRADTRTIYATERDDSLLRVYSIASNTWSVVGSHGLNLAGGGLTYDPWNHVLYATGGSNGNLYRIDPITAQATLVGSTGLPTANGGIEYVPAVYP